MNPLFTTETTSTRRCTEDPVASVKLRARCGGEKKCSAGFQPADGLVDTKRVIQAQMPARRRRYHFFSRPRSSQTAGKTTVHCALWSAAACCRLCSHGVAPAPRRRKQACALQKRRPKKVGKILARLQRIFDLVVWRSQRTSVCSVSPW